MKILVYFFLILGPTLLHALNPSEAFDKLMQGNERFRKQKNLSEPQMQKQRKATAAAQSPFAIIVACADSRVSPEILFDQGIGDLFVVRVAGNVIGPFELESINYAAKYLGSSCILVMGHENCGAVDAVVQGQTADIPFIAQLIKPSVVKTRANKENNQLLQATKMNAQAMSDFLKQSPIIANLISQGKIDVRAAYYNFQTGAVEMLNGSKQNSR